MFIMRAMGEVMSVRLDASCSSCSLQKHLVRWPSALYEVGQSMSLNVNEGTQDPENWTQYSSLVTALFTVYSQ
jgi:hypothetical protein